MKRNYVHITKEERKGKFKVVSHQQANVHGSRATLGFSSLKTFRHDMHSGRVINSSAVNKTVTVKQHSNTVVRNNVNIFNVRTLCNATRCEYFNLHAN